MGALVPSRPNFLHFYPVFGNILVSGTLKAYHWLPFVTFSQHEFGTCLIFMHAYSSFFKVETFSSNWMK